MIQDYKLQIGCMIVYLYVVFHYLYERKRLKESSINPFFNMLLIVGGVYYFADVVTVYTVNHLDSVPKLVNMLAHLVFLISMDAFVFLGFMHILKMTEAYPSGKRKFLLWVPFAVNIIVLVANIGNLRYVEGSVTNYSMGLSAYTCFVMSAVYIILTMIVFFWRWRYIEFHKKAGIAAYLGILGAVNLIQMIYPEILISSIAITVIILGIYLNIENPSMKKMFAYQDELVQGFAGIMEYKDDSTGGHIYRTTAYVELLAKELQSKGLYKSILTKDYINNLRKAAPMHDIGKIAIPDSILQKPGKLTDEEFAKMKEHAATGGEIIKKTLSEIGDRDYYRMVYQVARYHHEKWNGKGYPKGLEKEEIPLCARIMALADVFDAISQKRCYRDAMPLDKCFAIIEEGSGSDFEPELVEVFLNCKEEIAKVCMEFRGEKTEGDIS